MMSRERISSSQRVSTTTHCFVRRGGCQRGITHIRWRELRILSTPTFLGEVEGVSRIRGRRTCWCPETLWRPAICWSCPSWIVSLWMLLGL